MVLKKRWTFFGFFPKNQTRSSPIFHLLFFILSRKKILQQKKGVASSFLTYSEEWATLLFS
ncbi:hypothetical protein D1BOALGB6SA_3509 [Olavius sp. associated proteobacterium Delta 1]|nr:hypothetical protein D1BOALGB6SA_3509 [Olavius sp. associated proteobacterium Delta 1]